MESHAWPDGQWNGKRNLLLIKKTISWNNYWSKTWRRFHVTESSPKEAQRITAQRLGQPKRDELEEQKWRWRKTRDMRMTVREWMTQRRKGKTKEKTRFSVFHSFGFSFLMFSKVRSCMFITYKTEDDGINLWLLTVISFFFLTACLFSFILSSVILCRHSSSGPVINLILWDITWEICRGNYYL